MCDVRRFSECGDLGVVTVIACQEFRDNAHRSIAVCSVHPSVNHLDVRCYYGALMRRCQKKSNEIPSRIKRLQSTVA